MKGFVYHLPHDCHLHIDHIILAVWSRSSWLVLIYWVGLLVPPWLLVFGESWSSLMVSSFQSKALLAFSEEGKVPSAVRWSWTSTLQESQFSNLKCILSNYDLFQCIYQYCVLGLSFSIFGTVVSHEHSSHQQPNEMK